MKNSLQQLQSCLTLENWRKVNRKLLAKVLTEFMYEDLIFTESYKINEVTYQHHLSLENDTRYTFKASPRIFSNWHIDESSIKFYLEGVEQSELLVSSFICNCYKSIGIDELILGHLLRELNHTLLADCHILCTPDNHNDNLLSLDSPSLLEGYMHGHPWFVINKGRLGFSYAEYLNYAPEMRQLQQLSWLAVRKSMTSFSSISGLDYAQLIKQELSVSELEWFECILKNKDLNPEEYYLMPIHEWQWQRQIIQLFTEDIAKQNLIYLSTGNDYYLASQSIRSFNNQTHNTKFQVKLPMSILNTAVYRGLPNQRTKLAPLLSEWIKTTFASDSFFQEKQTLVMLGEVASINYSHPIYKNLDGVPYQYQELLGVIWRENVSQYTKTNEKVITMAALIHIDANDTPLINTIVERSGLTLDQWLEQFFNICLPPLLHWLYNYGVVFSPHGENTMLIMDENYLPRKIVLKDFIDDVNISNQDIAALANLPKQLFDTLYRLPDEDLAQFIQTGLFVVLYRYLSNLLETYNGYSEAQFWEQVHFTIQAYHHAHPEFKQQIESIGLLNEQFKKLNLNRLRILDVGYADYANRPSVSATISMNNPANPKYWKSPPISYIQERMV